jgi:universal stress protein E
MMTVVRSNQWTSAQRTIRRGLKSEICHSARENCMNPINRILVVVDPSVVGRQAAVDKAGLLARRLDASVELLICDIESALDDEVVTLHAHKTPPSNTQLLDLLDALAAPMRGEGIAVTVRSIYGKSLHDSLLDYIRGSNADLVVKDTHHHTFAKRTFLRNTDWHLMRGCRVPLLLTKKKAWGQPPVIMAAVDPIHANERVAALDRDILQWAASLEERLTGELHVIHTFVPTAFAAAVVAGRQHMTLEYSEALQVENSYRFRQIEHLVSAYGVTQERLHIEMGTPKDCFPQTLTTYRADVMVMGASSHGSWRRMVVGSTAETLLESMPCDVLIVRPLDDAQAVPC